MKQVTWFTDNRWMFLQRRKKMYWGENQTYNIYIENACDEITRTVHVKTLSNDHRLSNNHVFK